MAIALTLVVDWTDTGGMLKITVTSEKTSDDKVAAKVTVAAADVDATIKKTYKDIANHYNFQGFRRGHAPRPVINGILGRQNVLAQATANLMEAVQPQLIEELDVVPVQSPDWSDNDDNVVEHADFDATCTIIVPPELTLVSYEAPAIDMPSKDVSESEIDHQIDIVMRFRSNLEKDPNATEVKPNDIIDANVENIANASEFAGEHRVFSLDSNTLPDDFVKELIGMKVGETKDISWSHSEASDEEGTEQACELKLTLDAILKRAQVEITDEIAKKDFGFDTVEELRDAIKEDIEEGKANDYPKLKEQRVVAAIGDRVDPEKVPDSYVHQVYSELGEEFLGQLSRRGLTLDTYLAQQHITSSEFMADLRVQALERAEQSLALDALARHLGFECSDQDIDKEFKNAIGGDTKATIAEFLSSGRMPAIRQLVRRNKAVSWLVDNAIVTEVDETANSHAQQDKNNSAEPAPAEDVAPAEGAAPEDITAAE